MTKEKKVTRSKTKKEDKYKNIKEYYKRLRRGSIYTYREISEELEIRYYSGGNGKYKQLEVLSGLVDYEKVKEGYLIKDYRDKQVNVVDNRKNNGKTSVYKENYQLSLLGLLFQHRDSNFTTFDEKKKIYTVNLTKSYVFKELKLVNKNNYEEAKTKPLSYAQTIDVNIDTLWDNLDTIYDNCNANIRNNFQELHKKKLITFEENTMIYKVNPNVINNELGSATLDENRHIKYHKDTEYRLATKEEVALIRSVKRDILTEMNLKTEREIQNNKALKDKYYKRVELELLTKFNIEKTFKVYTIYFDDKTIVNYLNKFGGEEEIEEFQRLLGETNIERSIIAAKTRGTKAENLLSKSAEEISNKQIRVRTHENFKEDSVKICNSLKADSKNINNDIKLEIKLVKQLKEEESRLKKIEGDKKIIRALANVSSSKYDFIVAIKEMELLTKDYIDYINSFKFE